MLRGGSRRGGAGGEGAADRGGQDTRKREVERAAHAHRAVHPDVATRLPHDAVHGRQPEAGALAHRLGGEERLEDVLERFAAHTHAGVAHREHDVAAGHHLRAVELAEALDLRVLGANLQDTAGGHRVARVDGQVHEHLLDLARVSAGGPQLFTRREEEGHVLADHAVQQGQGGADQRVEVELTQLEHLTSAIGQQLTRELGRAPPRLRDHTGALAAVGVGQLVLQEAGGAVDDGEEVVEVVGDAAGQSSDRLHLLGLTQLGLQLDLAADVARDPHVRLHLAALVGDG